MTLLRRRAEAFEHRQLEPMRVRIVVLLADEDDIGLRRDRASIDSKSVNAPCARVVHALRHVARLRSQDRRR